MYKEFLLPKFTLSNNAINEIIDEEGNMHVAWETGNGGVVAFEYIPENYPSFIMRTFETVEEYEKYVSENEWLSKLLNE